MGLARYHHFDHNHDHNHDDDDGNDDDNDCVAGTTQARCTTMCVGWTRSMIGGRLEIMMLMMTIMVNKIYDRREVRNVLLCCSVLLICQWINVCIHICILTLTIVFIEWSRSCFSLKDSFTKIFWMDLIIIKLRWRGTQWFTLSRCFSFSQRALPRLWSSTWKRSRWVWKRWTRNDFEFVFSLQREREDENLYKNYVDAAR